MMAEQRESVRFSQGTRGSPVRGARVDDRPTLVIAGIDKHLADRARKYAAIPEQKFKSILTERRERVGEMMAEQREADLLPEGRPKKNGSAADPFPMNSFQVRN